MALDAATLALVANELNSTLLDAKIDKIFEPTRDEALMTLRTRTQTFKLLLSARSGSARVCLTKESFENAVRVHAAISGSTNATMLLPAIAHEFGIEIDADTFDRMHRGAHYQLNIRPSGDWPAQYFYYVGGGPRVMEEIRSMLHLDA